MHLFENFKIGTKLLIAFGSLLLLTTVLGVFAIYQMERVNQGAVELGTSWMPSTNRLADMERNILNFRRKEFQHILANDKETKDKFEKQMDEELKGFNAADAAYRKLITSTEEQKLYDEIKKTSGLFLAEHGKLIDASRRNQSAEAMALLEGDLRKHFLKASELLQKDIDHNVKGGEEEFRKSGAIYQTSKMLIISLLVACVVIGFIMAMLIIRAITRPLSQAVDAADRIASGDLTVAIETTSRDETGKLLSAMKNMVQNLRDMVTQTVDISAGIASASNQLHSTSEQIATGADEVACQANTVATAGEEMSHTSTDIARNCSMAAEAAQHTTESATAGAQIVNETITGMNVIAERVRRTAGTVEALGARSEQIGEIIGTIEDIADQTNLLALNAAIEAARAGEQGRGFAVVADEVRALAERTTKATREIGEMIEAIQKETHEAVKAMEEGVQEVEKGTVSSQRSGQALEEILNRINEVSMQISQIATAAEEQTATTGEVSTNIQQITEVVQQTARGAEETATAAAQLSGQAQQLQNLVGRFRIS